MMTNPFEQIDRSFTELKQELSELKDLLAHTQSAKIRDIGNIDLAEEESGLSRHTIYRLSSQGEFPVIKKGGRLYFSRKAIRDWIQSGNKEGGYHIMNKPQPMCKSLSFDQYQRCKI